MVALELVHVMLRLFKALAHENALTLLMNFQHMPMGALLAPPEYFLKNVRHVVHEIDRIIPTDHQVGIFQFQGNAWGRRGAGPWKHLRRITAQYHEERL